MRNVSIIILTYNNLEYTKQCIESIRTYTKAGTYEIIVVDNASSDNTVTWLREQADLKVIENTENVGFPAGCNQGARLTAPDNDILLLNNDTIVTTNWLENLMICLNSEESIGAAGAVSVSNANLQGIEDENFTMESLQEYARVHNQSCKEKWEEKLKLIGFCLLIKRNAWENIHGLDEKFTPGYYEDDDFSLRLLRAGYRLMLCHDCFIYHYLGTSFRSDQQKFYDLLAVNQQKFYEKWGFYTAEFDRVDMTELEKLQVLEHARILDVGCGIGTFIKKLEYHNPEAEVIGVEPVFALAKIAAFRNRVICQAVDDYVYSVEPHSVDQIWIHAPMSHLSDLVRMLYAMHYYLKQNGNLRFKFANASCIDNIHRVLEGGHMGENIQGSLVAGKKDILQILSQYGYDCISMIPCGMSTLDSVLEEMKDTTDSEQYELAKTKEYIVNAKCSANWSPMVNPKKIALIHCVNQEENYQSMLKNWKSLTVPYGYELECIPIRNASNICKAYNQAMNLSDAKYKIYLHQDTFFNIQDFLIKIINLFHQDKGIGVIGAVGAKMLPKTANWWESKDLWGTIYSEHTGTAQLYQFQTAQNAYEPVQVVDGVMIATQYDIRWREDILSGFHFYDVTQCLEFHRKGYRVVIPRQDNAWISHKCGMKDNAEDFMTYEKVRHEIISNYLKESEIDNA